MLHISNHYKGPENGILKCLLIFFGTTSSRGGDIFIILQNGWHLHTDTNVMTTYFVKSVLIFLLITLSYDQKKQKIKKPKKNDHPNICLL